MLAEKRATLTECPAGCAGGHTQDPLTEPLRSEVLGDWAARFPEGKWSHSRCSGCGVVYALHLLTGHHVLLGEARHGEGWRRAR